MRQDHVAGDKGFVDYSGKKTPIVDPKTGVIREAEIFVGVLGASSYTYAEAGWSQSLPDRIGAHVHKACRDDLSVVYHRVARLFAAFALARGVDGMPACSDRSPRLSFSSSTTGALSPSTPSNAATSSKSSRIGYDVGSILITSQLPLENWHEIIGDPTIADAVLDRVVHNAYRIELSGEGLRKTRGQDSQT